MTKVKDCLNETNGEHLESSHALPRGKWTGSHEKERGMCQESPQGRGNRAMPWAKFGAALEYSGRRISLIQIWTSAGTA